MAIDEALLSARLAGEAPPTVRCFGWRPAAVSLGYGQPLDGIDRAACARLGLGLVRRPTGGSAILHEDPSLELTYSVVARPGEHRLALEQTRSVCTEILYVIARVRQRRTPNAAQAASACRQDRLGCKQPDNSK